MVFAALVPIDMCLILEINGDDIEVAVAVEIAQRGAETDAFEIEAPFRGDLLRISSRRDCEMRCSFLLTVADASKTIPISRRTADRQHPSRGVCAGASLSVQLRGTPLVTYRSMRPSLSRSPNLMAQVQSVLETPASAAASMKRSVPVLI